MNTHLCKKSVAESIFLKEGLGKPEKYQELMPQLKALIDGEEDVIANVANIIAALKEVFSFLWIGIYFVKETKGKPQLVLGPFQGPPACVRIEKGRGVCGSAWERKETVIVPDVNLFPGHIACSILSRSEIVVPVLQNGYVIAVIDVDSTELAAFDETDQKYLSEIAQLISGLL